MELQLDGRTVTVDDKFRDLSPADQKASLEKIHAAMSQQAASETTPEDIGRGVGTGAIVGGLMGASGAGVAGLINDAVQYPTQYGYRAIDAVLGTDLAERHARSTGGYMGTTRALTENAEKLAANIVDPPVSKGGKIAQAVTSGGVEALAGSGLFRVGGRIFSSYDDAVKFAEQANVNPAVAATIKEMGQTPVVQGVYGAAAAGGGEIAQQNDVNPLIGTALALGATAAGHATAVPAARTAARAIDDALLQTAPSHEAAVAKRLRTQASNPEALEKWARSGETDELVPGSKPTLFEATDDIGIGGVQRQAFTDDTGGYKQAIEARRAEQNAARLAEIESVGGEGRVTAVLDEFKRRRAELDEIAGAYERTAQTEAEGAATRAGTTASAEDIGASIRGPVVAAERAAKAEGGRLYDAIGAEGVTVGTGRLKAAVGKEFRDIPENPLSTAEKQIADLVKDYGERLDFGLLQELRSRIAARARDFTGLNDVERRRASLLKSAIDQAMDDGLAKALDADPSLMQRAAGNVPIDDTLTQAQRRANEHWRETKQTFATDPVKPILQKAPTASGFKMTEAKIPETAFRPGNAGGERIRALRAAGAENDDLAEAAALSLQRGVIREGFVDPTAFRRWRNNHAAAIAELPPEVQRRFTSAADAAATLEQVATMRQATMRGFDESAVGKALGIPAEDLKKDIGTHLTTVSKARQLAAAAAKNPEAKAGLQRLVVDHILSRFKDPSANLKKARLTEYIAANKSQLEAIFGKEGANRFQRLADDIERSRKQMTTGKDPAGPSTAADLVKSAGNDSVMWLVASALGAKGIAALGLSKGVIGSIKLAGMKDVDAVLARALLDPEFARKLLTKAPALKNDKFRRGLTRTILRSSVAGMAYGGNQ